MEVDSTNLEPATIEMQEGPKIQLHSGIGAAFAYPRITIHSKRGQPGRYNTSKFAFEYVQVHTVRILAFVSGNTAKQVRDQAYVIGLAVCFNAAKRLEE